MGASPPRSYRDELRAKIGATALLQVFVITVEFALIVAAIGLLNIESSAFALVLAISLGGFLVHHFLPAAWRWCFFAVLSVTSVLAVMGWHHGGVLLGIGTVFIALCHLPIAMWARVGLVLIMACILAALRSQAVAWSPDGIPGTVWPVLGSMFMFRLIVYLYDLHHRAAPFSISRAISYFFMLPNVCFPLFPIVDYKTLQRSTGNHDLIRVYQTGLRWMLRGLVHLMIYKIVYHVGVIEPAEAVTGTDAARYMFCTFLLYFKVSGTFHLIVGLLHMYGFALPETHHLYLLSSSFVDLWRRINIYWKDFIQKIVFNPACFALRRFGETRALAGATMIAAVATWFLHACQWFWIRGEFPLIAVDMLFWAVLGTCLTVNVVLDSRRGKRRAPEDRTRTPAENVVLCLKTAGTFSALVVLWTMWNTPRLGEIALIWRALLNSGPFDIAALLGIPLCLGLIRVLAGNSRREVSVRTTVVPMVGRTFFVQAAAVSLLTAAIIALAWRPHVLDPLSPGLASLMEDVRWGRLNRLDLKQMQRGYYEDIGDTVRFNSELWALYGPQPVTWRWSFSSRQRADAIEGDFLPSTAEVFKGALRTINSLGLRDREYPPEPDPATYRIALIGSSHDMGAGVGDGETYENLVEDRLNRELGPRTGKKFEILNFSYGGYSPTQKIAVIEQRIYQFRPHLILYAATSHESDYVFKSLKHLADHDLLRQFPYVITAMDRAGIQAGATRRLPDKAVLDSKLAPFADETLSAVLRRFHDGASSRGIRSALVITEIPDDLPQRSPRFDRMVGLGQAAKLPVVDLQGAFNAVEDRRSLWIAPWDSHTNATGHRLLADRLYAQLIEKELVPLDAPAR